MIRQLIDFLETSELRPLDEEFLRNLWPTITEIVRHPENNPPAAVVLLLIAVTLVLLVCMTVALLVFRPRGNDDYEYEYVLVDENGEEIEGPHSDAPARDSSSRAALKDPLRHHRTALWGIGALVVLLLTAGVGSQAREVCLTCHQGIQHTAVVANDAHQSVRCTGCHESVNVLGAVTVAVPARMAHILSGFVEEAGGGYGPVSGSACRRCHTTVSREVVEIPGRAIRISHKEPLEAGAGCMHCHGLDEQRRIGRQTAGMSACLRCHNDANASADCSVCHTGDVGLAAISTAEHTPRQIIPQPDCYSCHEPESCDACHGVRLPHSPDYRLTHMMDAARDIWFDQGGTCFVCHTAERNSCYQVGCHANELNFHRGEDPTFPRTHGRDPEWVCDSCHVHAASFDDPCVMCHEHED